MACKPEINRILMSSWPPFLPCSSIFLQNWGGKEEQKQKILAEKRPKKGLHALLQAFMQFYRHSCQNGKVYDCFRLFVRTTPITKFMDGVILPRFPSQ